MPFMLRAYYPRSQGVGPGFKDGAQAYPVGPKGNLSVPLNPMFASRPGSYPLSPKPLKLIILLVSTEAALLGSYARRLACRVFCSGSGV